MDRKVSWLQPASISNEIFILFDVEYKIAESLKNWNLCCVFGLDNGAHKIRLQHIGLANSVVNGTLWTVTKMTPVNDNEKHN